MFKDTNKKKQSDLFKLEFGIIRARKASADVQQIHVEAQFFLRVAKIKEPLGFYSLLAE